MKYFSIIIFAFSLLAIVTSCQPPTRCNDSCCPCRIQRNPVTPKDAYYQNYYQSEPI